MSTIRTDPVTGRRVIIASERADRPRTFREKRSQLPYTEHCPFCVGNEDATPGDIRTYPDGEDDWSVRVVPNKYPAVSSPRTESRSDGDLFESTEGLGAHEVVIESPEHVVDLTALDVDAMTVVLQAWADRISDLGDDERLDYALVFKNHGAPAGASIEHTHSQLLALPVVPRQVEEELDGSRRHFDRHGRCVFCDIVDSAVDGDERLVYADDEIVVLTPYAPRFPFETWLLPREHASRFERDDEETYRAAASALLDTLGRLERGLDSPPYNLVLHTAPLRSDSMSEFHWHIELIPTLSHIAGFEWGAGCHINPTTPEASAEHLRELAADDDT